MEIGDTVIPNEDNEEEDLSRCSPFYLPLPAIRLGRGQWLARWTLNSSERKIVAETGDIYILLGATDGDELVSGHRLFVEKPNIQQLKEYYGETYKPRQVIQTEISKDENVEITKDSKDEIRLLIQKEISKAFDAALSAVINYPVGINDINSMEKRETRQKQNALVMEIGKAVKNALRDLEDEAHARIIEKTDPARAERIRKIKPTF
jgi:hypothetical protein